MFQILIQRFCSRVIELVPRGNGTLENVPCMWEMVHAFASLSCQYYFPVEIIDDFVFSDRVSSTITFGRGTNYDRSLILIREQPLHCWHEKGNKDEHEVSKPRTKLIIMIHSSPNLNEAHQLREVYESVRRSPSPSA